MGYYKLYDDKKSILFCLFVIFDFIIFCYYKLANICKKMGYYTAVWYFLPKFAHCNAYAHYDFFEQERRKKKYRNGKENSV